MQWKEYKAKVNITLQEVAHHFRCFPLRGKAAPVETQCRLGHLSMGVRRPPGDQQRHLL